ncbi:hypothetical protein GCM10010145_11970 [Streptomyces ruber]|uniref:Uncharacterized protein n=2 Tax=Streptomyces TaxID=1883 RepID=A0A918BAJ9_9ACTN|nr:hypothetical protein [Streptomyces ruber]GGQ44905.1 hypothetical protein GCM10010145_11970 [Streptomyces ruber]
MTSTDNLITRARLAIEAEEKARVVAKAAELAEADKHAESVAERQAQHDQLKADAEAALSAEGVTLPELADLFDAAVAALAALAEGACTRNDLIGQHAAGLALAKLPNAERTPVRELLARATAQAAEQVRGRDTDLGRLITSLNADGGPLWRITPVERARRVQTSTDHVDLPL